MHEPVSGEIGGRTPRCRPVFEDRKARRTGAGQRSVHRVVRPQNPQPLSNLRPTIDDGLLESVGHLPKVTQPSRVGREGVYGTFWWVRGQPSGPPVERSRRRNTDFGNRDDHVETRQIRQLGDLVAAPESRAQPTVEKERHIASQPFRQAVELDPRRDRSATDGRAAPGPLRRRPSRRPARPPPGSSWSGRIVRHP